MRPTKTGCLWKAADQRSPEPGPAAGRGRYREFGGHTADRYQPAVRDEPGSRYTESHRQQWRFDRGTGRKIRRHFLCKQKLRTLDELEEKVRIKMEQLYEEVNQKKQAYDAAKTGLDGAEILWSNIQNQYRMGMLSDAEYLEKQLPYMQKRWPLIRQTWRFFRHWKIIIGRWRVLWFSIRRGG